MKGALRHGLGADATVATTVARRLAASGVRRVFGFPGGGGNLDLIAALTRSGIEFVLTRTEVGGAFMAAATAELTGGLGVMMVGNGPGLASVVNGVAHAHLDRVPLLLISDRYTDAEARTSGHQVLDQRTLLRPIVKSSIALEARGAADAVENAIMTALAAPRGPVHVDIPRDVAAVPVRDDTAAAQTPPVRSEPSGVASGSLEAAAQRLRDAERPVLLAGLECNHAVRPEDLRVLADRLGAAVLTTYKAKGILPEAHPLWAGIFTGGVIEAPLLEASDALLAIGLDPVELLTVPWRYDAPELDMRTCSQGGEYFGARTRWTGELGAGVRELAELVSDHPARTPDIEAIASYRERALDRLRVPPRAGMATWQLVEAIVSETPGNATVAVDAGAHMFAATAFWRSLEPRRFLISNGLASMGFAVPAAVAAAIAQPGAVSVAITGDGGMAYNSFELETAVRHSAAVVVVVVNDASLSLIRLKHEAKGHPGRQLDLSALRFDHLGAALGIDGEVVVTEQELRGAMRRALAARRASIIDARVEGSEYGATLEAVRGS